MKFLTFEIQKAPGFRFNLIDLIFILLLAMASLGLYRSFDTFMSLYILPLYVGFTFFLFCNVFRVGTRKELWWIVLFFMIAVTNYLVLGVAWFWPTVVIAGMVQVVLVVLQVRSDDYRGIFAKEA